jgi:hypothetical protein
MGFLRGVAGVALALVGVAAAGEDAETAYRAALKGIAKRERAFWEEFPKRQAQAAEVAREPWREMVRSMNGHGTQVDIEIDHSGFRALYEDYVRIERERVAAADALGEGSIGLLWSELLVACAAIDAADALVEAIDDPTGDTWASTNQEPGIRRHGLEVRLDGLIAALARLPGAPALVATKGWEEAAKGDRARSVTRRVAVLDLLAAAGAREGAPLADQMTSAKASSLRIAAVECALRLDPAPRAALLPCLRDISPPVRRALLAAVRARGGPPWIPPLVDRLPETGGLERLECLAALAKLAGRHLGPDPAAWKAWCDAERAAIDAGTFRAGGDDARATVALPGTTSFYGVTPLSEGIIFVLEGGESLHVPADYGVQRTKAFFDWIVGNPDWRKEHASHRDVQLREFTAAVGRLGADVGIAVVLATDNGGVKVLGERRLLRGKGDRARAVRFLETHAPRGYRSELANLRTALGLAGLPVPGHDFPKAGADTILLVADGSLRGGPYLDPDAAALAFARWNRFRRVALHAIRICNGGADSELLLRKLAEAGGGTYQWRRAPP